MVFVFMFEPHRAPANLDNPAEFVLGREPLNNITERIGTSLEIREYQVFNNAALAVHNWIPDPSFEPTVLRYKFRAVGGSSTEIALNNTADSEADATLGGTVTDGFFDGATVRVYRRPANGAFTQVRTGTVQNYFASSGNSYRITLTTSGPSVQTGDLVFLETDRLLVTGLDPVSAASMNLNDWQEVGAPASWGLIPHSAFNPLVAGAPDFPGDTFLRIQNTGSGTVGASTFMAGSPDDNFNSLEPGRQYRVRLWLRQSGMVAPSVTTRFNGPYASISNTFSGITGTWSSYQFDFTAPARPTAGDGARFIIEFTGTGELFIDSVWLYPADEEPFSLRDEVMQELIDFQPGTLRNFAGWINEGYGRSLDAFTRWDEESPRVWSRGGRDAPLYYNLPKFLPLCRDLGTIPWLLISPSFSEDEWRGLIEYLAAPYDPLVDTPATKPWAARRYEQGQIAPWTDEFPSIRIEFGNETWNEVYDPWTFTGEDYGRMFQYFMDDLAANSPYWTAAEPSLEFILGGFVEFPEIDEHGAQAITQAPAADFVGVAGYTGGFETGLLLGGGTINDDGYREVLRHPAYYQQALINRQEATRQQLAGMGVNYELVMYEGGPGYPLPSPTMLFDPSQEAYGKSLAGGVAALDIVQLHRRFGFPFQSFYNFESGFNYASHTELDLTPYRQHPVWTALQLFNEHVAGEQAAAIRVKAPHTPMPEISEGGFTIIPALEALPLVAAYPYLDGSNYHVVLISRKLEGVTPVTLHLPLESTTQVTRRRLVGDPRDTNIDTQNISVLTDSVSTSEFPLVRVELDPGTVQILSFENATFPVVTNPTVRVFRAYDQPPLTMEPAAIFTVVFSQPVTGFTASDVIIQGNTQPQTVTVEPEANSNGAAFRITLDGLQNLGQVGLSIPAGAAQDSDSRPNLASNLDGEIVTYSLTTAPSADWLRYE
jgi:hypothetical protein